MAWNLRDISVAEAAQVVGLHRKHLDVIMVRTRPLSCLYCGKRGKRNWFSPKDIAVLRVALELERAGRNWSTAIAQAFEHLGQPPPPDAVLVVPVMSVSPTSGRVLTGLATVPVSDQSFITIPIGRIAAEIQEAAHGLV